MSRTLIIFGLVVVAAGLLWPFLSKLGLGFGPQSLKQASSISNLSLKPDVARLMLDDR
jgi:hypothetical protein